MSEALIDFSSANVLYSEGIIGAEASGSAAEWQTVRVVLAELTSETYGLAIFHVFDCGLTSNSSTPVVEMLIPDPLVSFEGKEQSRRIIITRDLTEHHLRFNNTQEFWNVMDVISHMRSEEENRLAGLMTRLRQIRTTVPSHSANPASDSWCQNSAHTSGALNQPGFAPRSRSPTVIGSPTTTVADSPTIAGAASTNAQ